MSQALFSLWLFPCWLKNPTVGQVRVWPEGAINFQVSGGHIGKCSELLPTHKRGCICGETPNLQQNLAVLGIFSRAFKISTFTRLINWIKRFNKIYPSAADDDCTSIEMHFRTFNQVELYLHMFKEGRSWWREKVLESQHESKDSEAKGEAV